MLQLHPSRRGETAASIIPRLQLCERVTAKEKAQRVPKGLSGRKFFSNFMSPEQSYASALSQDTQYQRQRYELSKYVYLQDSMKGYLLQIITFIGLIAFHEEEAELPLQ
jgi:hypothetical protein